MKLIHEFHGGVAVSNRKRAGLSEVGCHFQSLENPRSPVNRHHPLVSVLVISLMAVLSGADGPTAIRKWAESKRDLLLDVLDLPKGIPSKDVFRRVLMALDPQAFQACFVSWLNSLQTGSDSEAGQRPSMAVDGKRLRGSHDRSKGLGPLHLVSVWLTQAGLTLAQTATDQKSNEITAIPEVLKLVDMTDAIISIDAMGTQTAIAEQIVDGGGDYVLALKANQSGLHDAVIEHVKSMSMMISRGSIHGSMLKRTTNTAGTKRGPTSSFPSRKTSRVDRDGKACGQSVW